MDLSEEFEKHKNNLLETISSPMDSYSFKSVFKAIPEEVFELLKEANEDDLLNNFPNLVIISLVSLDEDNPCGVCNEAISQLKQWGLDNGAIGDGKVRVLFVPELDEKKLWNKIGANHDEVPKHYIFNKQFALIDVVNGVMTGGYIETFYGDLINEK